MNVADYLVDYFISKKISDVFGYPGGMVIYLMESLYLRRNEISAHVNYHEQGASFAACGYAQASNIPGVAYATSGPGATNLITGICNAYFDSIPAIFITGQVNMFESKGNLAVRQRGFQETDIVSMVKPVTKYAVQVTEVNSVRYHLEKAFELSVSGRPGPVLLDIPMNIQRSIIEPSLCEPYCADHAITETVDVNVVIEMLRRSHKPCIIAGAGITQSGLHENFRKLVEQLEIPIITSMIAIDVIPSEHPCNFGFVGVYGHRYSNFILSKSDLIISIGTRLDIRQTGTNHKRFADKAKLIRIDIDEDELSNKIKDDEIQIIGDIKTLIPQISESIKSSGIDFRNRFRNWMMHGLKIKSLLENRDNLNPNNLMGKISAMIPDNSIITTDVGQNQVWVSQSFIIKKHQRILFTGGHGAMGYSIPAAIGAHYACPEKHVFSMIGDGGFMMNIQELQFLARENIPITIILFNNRALGMIRHFQEMYFNANYEQTTSKHGYEVPDFEKIAHAFGFEYRLISSESDVAEDLFACQKPCIVEVLLNENTYVFPKLGIDKAIHDQEPPLDRELHDYIMEL